MRTIVYIDGYNLYYSALRQSRYKWLDMVKLFSAHILHAQDPTLNLIRLKFFTAPVKAKFAAHGRDSVTAQNEYHRALKALYGDFVEIIPGFHETRKHPMMRHQEPPSRDDRVDVWNIEEKQTDVNMALHLYRDAARDSADCLVVCSNDSDVAPAMALVRQDFPQLQLGLVVPLLAQGDTQRVANKRLIHQAHWVRHTVREDELVRSQLNDVVPTPRKAARKPSHW
jgi:uncharacterized LabA/DUF88 family protein